MPTGVWANQGFDGEAIEKGSLPEDVMHHRLFGLVYRVPILEVNSRVGV